jgi:hypothetical protein
MDQATFDAVLRDIRRGVATYVATKENGTCKTEFYDAIAEDEVLADRYARAKEVACEAWADETIEIIDEEPPLIESDNGGQRMDAAFVAWQRNRVEARKWHLAKLKPKVYGDRLNVDQEVTMHFEKQLTERLEDARKRLTIVGESTKVA